MRLHPTPLTVVGMNCLCSLQMFMPLQLHHHHHHHHHHIHISRHFYPRTFVATRSTSTPNHWMIALLRIYGNGPYVCLSQDLGAGLGTHIFICLCVPPTL